MKNSKRKLEYHRENDYLIPNVAMKNNNFMDYLCYWNEKYYRNGFVDGVQITIGCIKA